ncbi:MAG: hypothetical protein SangKO_000550 [Sandaracinaceae bacterium]
MTQITVTVYQRKRKAQLEWATVGLGARTLRRVGKSPTKIQRGLADELRKSIRNMSPMEVAALELVRGRRLRRVHLELTVADRKRVSGRFPLVLEPRWRRPGERVVIAYHPLLGDQFFLVDEEELIAEQAKRFFAHVWRELDEVFVTEQLVTDGKDLLRAFSFSERAPQLIDEIVPEADPFADLEVDPDRGKRKKKRKKKKHGRKQLRAIGENVTARVADGVAPLGRPREPWRSQLAQLLNGPRKQPVVLLGPPGVGKSTLLHRWVSDLLEADDYAAHRNLDRAHEVWRLSATRVLAGMSYVGDWEKRCVELTHEAADPRVVLWVDDLHTFGTAGRSRQSERSLADFFRGPVARGEVTMIGEATPAQWHRLQEHAPAFADRFTTLRVTPTDAAETLQLLLHEARELEPAREVAFRPEVYRAVMQLGETLHPGTARPGVAVDLLRRLAADAAFSADGWTELDADAVVGFLARRTGLPEVLLRPDASLDPAALEDAFRQHVLGQDEAVRAAVDLVARIRAGLTDPERPFATYLFTGPTGTGKTQMAKALAGFLYGDESRLVRVDMGEMTGPESVARLIGDRYDPRGLLTDAVRQQPFSVVLLDEVEKAHPAVLQLLLQLLDEGRLTDAGGAVTDFRRAVIVMTSNLGARPRASVGFGERADAVLREVDRAVRDFFPPELFNRIDRVVPFAPLTPEIAELVCEKELAQLLARRGLTDRRVFVFPHPDAVKRMAADAFDARDGARSVKRHLEATVGALLSDELARGSRAEMRMARVYAADDGYRLHVDELIEAEPEEARYELEGLLHEPASVLNRLLPRMLARVRDLSESAEVEALAERVGALVAELGGGDPGVARTLYALDRFRAELRALRDDLELRTSANRDVERELSVDAVRERREPWGWRGGPSKMKRLDRRHVRPPSAALSREELLRRAGEIALLERAVHRLGDAREHRVLLELLRVGQGRRPPRYDRAPDGLFEWLAELYTGLRGDVLAASARRPDGSILTLEEPLELGALLAAHPNHLVLELHGVAMRTFLEGEQGCHVWSSLLSGAEIVRVRLTDAESCEDVLHEHDRSARAFERALQEGRGEGLPEDPARLLPAVRRLRFDPPTRPGESSLLEVEDYVTGQVMVENVRRIPDALRALTWLRASRARGAS